MKKKIIKVTVIVAILYTVTTSFSSKNKVGAVYNIPIEGKISTVLNEDQISYNFTKNTYGIPFVGRSYLGFKEALAFKESQGKYGRINTFGYLGKYQFGKSTLKRFKIYDTSEFLSDSELQENAFLALCKVNKWILIRDIKRFNGKRINGVKITESGILAAAHLAGAGNVKKYLRSYGAVRFEDAYGTSIANYMKKFAGFDTSLVKANRKPQLQNR